MSVAAPAALPSPLAPRAAPPASAAIHVGGDGEPPGVGKLLFVTDAEIDAEREPLRDRVAVNECVRDCVAVDEGVRDCVAVDERVLDLVGDTVGLVVRNTVKARLLVTLTLRERETVMLALFDRDAVREMVAVGAIDAPRDLVPDCVRSAVVDADTDGDEVIVAFSVRDGDGATLSVTL